MSGGPMGVQRFERAERWSARVTGGAVAATLLSGVGLLVASQPAPGLGVRLIWLVHLVAVVVVAQGAIALAALGLVRSHHAVDIVRRVLGLFVVLVAVVVAAVTGTLLGWDQVARESPPPVDTDLRGFGWIFDDDVAFVLVDGAVVGVDTVQRLLAVHVGSAIVVGVAIVLAGMRSKRRVLHR